MSMKNIFKRWTVFDGISQQTTSEKFFRRKDAEELRDAVEFLYVLDGIKTGDPVDPFYFKAIKVVRA